VSLRKRTKKKYHILADSHIRTTEILDVAPIDLLNGAAKEFTSELPDDLLAPELKAQAIDFEYHWVTETGVAPALLTSGIKMLPTVGSSEFSTTDCSPH
jgi:hypothetical protein